MQGREVLTAYAPIPPLRLADVRRAADRRGLCAALRIDQAVELSAARRRSLLAFLAGLFLAPQDGRADPGAARRRGADRQRRSRAAHLDQDRRRAGRARRPVQRHGRAAGGILRRPGEEGRGSHARAGPVGRGADARSARSPRRSTRRSICETVLYTIVAKADAAFRHGRPARSTCSTRQPQNSSCARPTE